MLRLRVPKNVSNKPFTGRRGKKGFSRGGGKSGVEEGDKAGRAKDYFHKRKNTNHWKLPIALFKEDEDCNGSALGEVSKAMWS